MTSPAEDLRILCRQIRSRSAEHQAALGHLHPARLHGQVVSILRQELDSLVRVVYLLHVNEDARRADLVRDAVEGIQWIQPHSRRRVTDREMAKLADGLNGWTLSVYKFGCAFIHLSSFHDYRERDPMEMISQEEREAILSHMRHYHGGPCGSRPTFDELANFLPDVFRKIASNLESYLKQLEELALTVPDDISTPKACE